MRSIVIFCFVCICCLFFSPLLMAQNTPVNGEFKNMYFPEFAKQMEAKTHFHFYYKKTELDSFSINITIVNQQITQILNLVFQTTDFRFSIDTFNHVFITKNIKLQTRLSADFFIPEDNNIDQNKDFSENEESAKQKAPTVFAENKLYKIGSLASAKKGNSILTGFVKDIKNGEAITGASLYIDSVYTGIVTDQFGYYSVTLKPGNHILEVTITFFKLRISSFKSILYFPSE